MGAEALALNAGIYRVEANGLLSSHKRTYRVFWELAEANQMRALMGEPLVTPLGWKTQLRNDPDPNNRSLLNWPMQSTGADIMRLSACELTEAGIEVCCPIHDAFLIRFSLSGEAYVIAKATQIMASALRESCVKGMPVALRLTSYVILTDIWTNAEKLCLAK